MRIGYAILATLIITVCISAAQAQSTAASGSHVIVPVLAQTASYTSEVFVRNPNSSPITLSVTLHQGHDYGTNLASPFPCTDLSVPAFQSIRFTVPAQCPGIGNGFSMLDLEDKAVPATDQFFVYTRTQTPGGNGFSVEGFPIGAFSGAPAVVDGLKRQAASPTYQSNCFLGALSEGFSYQVLLIDGNTGNPLSGSNNPITGTADPFTIVRFFDVFAVAGLPSGDVSNVQAEFSVTAGGQPAMVPFCTVQESTFFGADFRIAKSQDALSDAQRRLACIGQDNCGVANGVSVLQPEQITDATMRNVYSMIITPPDFVRCDLVASTTDLPNLQIRLREPGSAFSSTVFPASGTFSNTGTNSFFYIDTGGRNAASNGTATRWFMDVETKSGGATVPIDFGITCTSGNGTEVPWFRGTAARY